MKKNQFIKKVGFRLWCQLAHLWAKFESMESMERTVVITDVDTNRSLKTGITTQRISGVPKGTMRLWCMGLPRPVSAYQQVVQAFVDEDLNT